MALSIIIDHTKIDEELTDFPLLVVLNSDVLSSTELEIINNDPKKVSFVDSENNELYVEIESTNTVETRYWVKVTSILSTADTIVRFSFGLISDSAYVGNIGDLAAQAVWSNGYEAVYHMGQDPSIGNILDSVQGRDITPDSTYLSDDLVFDSVYGYGLKSDSGNISCLGGPYDFSAMEDGFTIEALFNAVSFPSWSRIVDIGTSSAGSLFHGPINPSNYSLAVWYSNAYTAIAPIADQFIYATQYLTSGVLHVIVDEELDINNHSVTVTDLSASQIRLFIAGSGQKADMSLYGLKISNVTRSKAWIDASNRVVKNTLTTISSSFFLSGTVTDGQSNPIVAPVALYNQTTKELVATTTSDAITGEYRFDSILNEPHFIIAFPDTYRAKVFNNLTPLEAE